MTSLNSKLIYVIYDQYLNKISKAIDEFLSNKIINQLRFGKNNQFSQKTQIKPIWAVFQSSNWAFFTNGFPFPLNNRKQLILCKINKLCSNFYKMSEKGNKLHVNLFLNKLTCSTELRSLRMAPESCFIKIYNLN